MERYKLVSRTPVVDLQTGCWTAHGIRTMLALIQATGGGVDGIIPLPADADLVDILLEIQQLYAFTGEVNSRASQGVQANKRIDALFDPSSLDGMIGTLKSELSTLRKEVDAIKNQDPAAKIGGLLAEIKQIKFKLNEVEAICLSTLGAR